MRHLLVLCLVLLFLVACGGGGGDPTTTVNAYHQALIDGDVDAALALTAGSPERSAVETTVEIRQPGMQRGGLPEIVSHSIDDDRATVVCRFGPVEQEVSLVREDGVWRVVALSR